MRARSLRQSSTDAEAKLWHRLRSRQLLNLKFRRQHPIGPYFADFACLELGLVIELDGGQHNDASATVYDQQRAEHMQLAGFRTLRFWNNDVLADTDAVLESIRQAAHSLLERGALTPALSRAAGEGAQTFAEGEPA